MKTAYCLLEATVLTVGRTMVPRRAATIYDEGVADHQIVLHHVCGRPVPRGTTTRALDMLLASTASLLATLGRYVALAPPPVPIAYRRRRRTRLRIRPRHAAYAHALAHTRQRGPTHTGTLHTPTEAPILGRLPRAVGTTSGAGSLNRTCAGPNKHQHWAGSPTAQQLATPQ